MQKKLKKDKLLIMINDATLLKERDCILHNYFDVYSVQDLSPSILYKENGEGTCLQRAQVFSESVGEAFWVLAYDFNLIVPKLKLQLNTHPTGELRENTKDVYNLLSQLEGFPTCERGATLIGNFALVKAGKSPILSISIAQGYIAREPVGEAEYTYDSVFYVTKYGKTLSQLHWTEQINATHIDAALQSLLREYCSQLSEQVQSF